MGHGDFGGDDDFGFDQNAPETEDDFGGNFDGPGGGPSGGNDGDADGDWRDVGLFSFLGTILGLFAKSTPLGIGVRIGGRILDKFAGTETTLSDAARRGVKAGLNSRNFEGDDFDPPYSIGDEIASLPDSATNRRRGKSAGPAPSGARGSLFEGPSDFDSDGGPVVPILQRRAARRPSTAPGGAPPGASGPVTVASAFAGERRPRTLFATERGLGDTLGG